MRVNASGWFFHIRHGRMAVTLISSKFFVGKTCYEHCTRMYSVHIVPLLCSNVVDGCIFSKGG